MRCSGKEGGGMECIRLVVGVRGVPYDRDRGVMMTDFSKIENVLGLARECRESLRDKENLKEPSGAAFVKQTYLYAISILFDNGAQPLAIASMRSLIGRCVMTVCLPKQSMRPTKSY